MKKLIIRDHLGDVVFEADVYMEGQDYYHVEPRAKPIWLQEVHICDPDKLPEFIKEAITEVAPEPEPELELEDTKQREKDMEQAAIDAGYLEPEPEPELNVPTQAYRIVKDCYKKEAKHEPKAAINQRAGDKGFSEAEQSESPEAAPTKPAKRKATKRSK